jgi:hypothetical protein
MLPASVDTNRYISSTFTLSERNPSFIVKEGVNNWSTPNLWTNLSGTDRSRVHMKAQMEEELEIPYHPWRHWLSWTTPHPLCCANNRHATAQLKRQGFYACRRHEWCISPSSLGTPPPTSHAISLSITYPTMFMQVQVSKFWPTSPSKRFRIVQNRNQTADIIMPTGRPGCSCRQPRIKLKYTHPRFIDPEKRTAICSKDQCLKKLTERFPWPAT